MISTLYSPGRGELRWSHRRFCRDNESSPMQCVMAPEPIGVDIDPHKMTISIHYKMSCNFVTKAECGVEKWRYIGSCGGYGVIHPGHGGRNASAECGGEKWRYIGSCGDRVLGGDADAAARGYRAIHPGGGGGDGEGR